MSCYIIHHTSNTWQALARLSKFGKYDETTAGAFARRCYHLNIYAFTCRYGDNDAAEEARKAMAKITDINYNTELTAKKEKNGCPQVVADCYRIVNWLYQCCEGDTESSELYKNVEGWLNHLLPVAVVAIQDEHPYWKIEINEDVNFARRNFIARYFDEHDEYRKELNLNDFSN